MKHPTISRDFWHDFLFENRLLDSLKSILHQKRKIWLSNKKTLKKTSKHNRSIRRMSQRPEILRRFEVQKSKMVADVPSLRVETGLTSKDLKKMYPLSWDFFHFAQLRSKAKRLKSQSDFLLNLRLAQQRQPLSFKNRTFSQQSCMKSRHHKLKSDKQKLI